MIFKQISWKTVILVAIVVVTGLTACRKKEKIDSDPALSLSFSGDTIFFDTVFSTVGSVTKRLMVYNQHDSKIRISTIRLSGGASSNYRININGTPVSGLSDVDIPANDSIFIFIRVTVDPNNDNSPFIVKDSIEFQTNGNIQFIRLVSWGQNANFYRETTISKNTEWDSLKAHVIYGSLKVDSGATLTIQPGTKVYFHLNSYMELSAGTSLKVLGTLDHPVSFQGDRLDFFYRDLPGQWDGIYLDQGSRDHEINYAVIKNGSFGLAADSTGMDPVPLLSLHNTKIQNMTIAGVYSYGSSIESTNCVIGNCGYAALYITYGGSYSFRHLTVGNYWYSSVRNTPSINIRNYDYDSTGRVVSNPLTSAFFGNCILYGANDEEILLDSAAAVPFVFSFDHALLKTRMLTSIPSGFISCQINKDPRFIDINRMDFRIDSLSPAIKQGIPMGVPYDLIGIERADPPDLGAYQYFKDNK